MGDKTERIQKLQAGNEAAWEELVREFSPQLLRYFSYHLAGRDEGMAEDLTQETFTCALQAFDRFQDQYSLAQFLFGIGRHRLVDHLRRQGHREALLPATPPGDDAAGSTGRGFLSGMPSERRSPAESVMAFESAGRQREALLECLQTLVEHLWTRGDFEQLKILEFLLVLSGRNRDAAQMFTIESERAVAGIKFRALGKIRDCLREKDPTQTLFPGLWAPGAM